MILIDTNQVMIANLMVQIGNHQNAELDENMLRHMVINTIRSYKMKFGDEYGELIVCTDDKNYWRKDVFPYYKASRKKARDASELDWQLIFKSLNKIREELKEYFPYRVIHIDRAEADDIIGTIVHAKGAILGANEPILILSGDKDYIQLHTYSNVSQYDPTRKKWVKHSNPEEYLREHIMKGDFGDGVPNVMSPDNSLVMGIRQKPITKKRLEDWKDINTAPSEVQVNWNRNQKLIDLSQVPTDIQEKIMEEFEKENPKDRSRLLNYFIDKRLKHLMEHLPEF